MHNARCRDRNRLNANEIIDHGSDNDIQNKLNRIFRPVGLPEAQPGRGLDAQHPSPARTAAVHDHIVPGHVAGSFRAQELNRRAVFFSGCQRDVLAKPFDKSTLKIIDPSQLGEDGAF